MQQRADLGDGWREILDFERSWHASGTRKEVAIRKRMQVSSVRYYQQLNRAIDLPAALEYDPVLVRRLLRLRERRRRVRFGPGPVARHRPGWQDGRGR